jgi:hypothetical protein
MSENKTIIEERHLPEDEGFLGSKITSVAPDGSLVKEIRTPFCDCCGRVLVDEKPALCSCKRKICKECAVQHEGKIYCNDCAKQITDVSKDGFFLLYGLAKDATLKDIKQASSMSSDHLETLIETLLERKLIERKGLSLFAYYRITNTGLTLLATAEQIYGNEGDALRFLFALKVPTEAEL